MIKAWMMKKLISSFYPPVYNSTYVKSTTEFAGGDYSPFFATDPSKSLIGVWSGQVSWVSQDTVNTNQRFHIDLGSAIAIQRIYYENAHHSGTYTDAGAKNFTFWGSNTAGDFADLVYANNGTWVQLTTNVSAFEQHVAANQADPKYITVINSTPYRYYAFKFADCWGSTGMGVRRIELQV